MAIPNGQVTDIIKDNPVVKGCTVSDQLFHDSDASVSVFSLAAQTSISSSIYAHYQLIIVEEGQLNISVAGQPQKLQTGDSLLTPKGVMISFEATKDSIYTEISFTKDTVINSIIQVGKVFKISELIPYQKDKIVNCDLVTGRSFKLALMALSTGTELAEHSAPGKAMIMALDGKGLVNYQGEEKILQPGKALKMSKGAHHAVKASGSFKMALLVMTPSN